MRYQLLLSTDILSSVVCVYLFVRPKLQEKAKNIQPLPRHTKNDEKNQIPAGHTQKTKKWYFRTKFYFRKAFPSTFSEENGRAEVGEKNSNNTFLYDDDAQKFVLCTRSPFFKENVFKDTPCDKKQQSQV